MQANVLSSPYVSMPSDEAAALRNVATYSSIALRAASRHASRNASTSCSVGTCHMETSKHKKCQMHVLKTTGTVQMLLHTTTLFTRAVILRHT